MGEFFSWQMLATAAGAATATAVITQFVKGAFAKIPTQLLSYIIALVLLGIATAATAQGATWETWAIIPLNAVIVSLSSNGAFSAVSRKAKGAGDAHEDA